MFDENGFELYEVAPCPLAYLLTFRTFGNWLPGDVRGSYDKKRNKYGSNWIAPNRPLHDKMADLTKTKVLLSENQRRIVHEAILETCKHRGYLLQALNVRSNHLHAVVSKAVRPEKIVNDFKAYATRALRANHEVGSSENVWARGSSTRYLWKPKHVTGAIDYVLYSQGDIPFEIKGE